MATGGCVAEFGRCAQGSSCCAPHRCYEQSQWYSQCGRACPPDSSWACSQEPPSIGLLVARWGGWPPWTPFLLRTMAANPDVTFLLLSDHQPPTERPANVEFVHMPLEALLSRLQSAIGLQLRSLGTKPQLVRLRLDLDKSSSSRNNWTTQDEMHYAVLYSPKCASRMDNVVA